MGHPLRHSLIAAAVLAAMPAGAQAAVTGMQLTQRDADGQSVLTLGGNGARLLLTTAGDRSPSFGTILRYAQRRAIAFDPVRRIYVDLSLSQALARARVLRRAVIPTTPLPEGIDRPAASTGRASLQTLRGLVRVRGLQGKVSQVSLAGTTVRVTYAQGLPQAPGALTRGLADRAFRGDPVGAALGSRLGSIPMRVEVREGSRFVRTLDTTSARSVTLASTTFDVPRGFRRVRTAEFFGPPAQPARTATSALVVPINPELPVASHPRVTNLFWGKGFFGTAGTTRRDDLNSATNEAVKTPYGRAMRQYGILRLPGKRTRSHRENKNPPSDVGGTGVAGPAHVVGFIWDEMLRGRAPAYWVCCDRDPMIFTFVIEEDVASAPWHGYHFWVPTLGSLVSWPLSLWIHAGVPYTLVKVPRNSLSSATNTLGHEYVEAATDPFPLFGWLDPLKTPPWTDGEISDICANDTHSTVNIGGFDFNTYWSNVDRRCMP